MLREHACGIETVIAVTAGSSLPSVVEALYADWENVTIWEIHPSARTLQPPSEWQIAAHAILELLPDEVLVLNPHTVPLRNPAYLFDYPSSSQSGALLWRKFGAPVERDEFSRSLGLAPKERPEIDSTPFLLAAKRHARILQLALELSQSEPVLKGLWGNTAETLQYAFHREGKEFALIKNPPQPWFNDSRRFPCLAGMCYADPDGTPIFQNRRYSPWSLGAPREIKGAVFEPLCFEFLRELRGVLPRILALPANGSAEWSGRWLLEPDPAFPLHRDVKSAAALPPSNALDFDHWIEASFCDDGVAEILSEPNIAFWREGASETVPLIELLDRDLAPVATLKRGLDGIFTGHWLHTGQSCRLVRENSLAELSRMKLGDSLARDEVKATDPNSQPPLHLSSISESLSDAVSSLFCACSIANSGRHVIWHTAFASWFHRIKHRGLIVARELKSENGSTQPLAEKLAPADFHLLHPYSELASRQRISPSMNKCQSVDPGLKPVIPTQIDRQTDAETSHLEFLRYVLIVPYVENQRDEWPVSHWKRLIFLLRRSGLEVVAIGERNYSSRFARDFRDMPAFWLERQNVDRLLDAMLQSHALIAPLSGLAGIAALHGVRTIALTAEFTPEYFPPGITVDFASGKASCQGCWKREDAGFLASCRVACAGMALISPEEVMAKVFIQNEAALAPLHDH